MTDDERVTLAIGFPLHEADRATMRQRIGHPLPAIYPDSIAAPCALCAMELAVGPKIAAALASDATIRLVCPHCLAERLGQWNAFGFDLRSLDNPDSKFENE